MNLNLKQLEAFVWAVDLGSFSKAAIRLNTTQPNISIRVQALEKSLGVELLERDAGSVRLTSIGKTLLTHARTVLNSVEQLTIASGNESQRQGTLRLGVTEMVVHTWLPDFLKALHDAYPNIQVELTVDLSSTLSQELFARSLDLTLQNGPFSRESTGSESLGFYPLIWVASPELDLSKANKSKTNITANQLTKHPILTNARDSDLYKSIANHFNSINFHDVNLVPSSNLSACLYMAKNQMGVASLPRSMVREALNKKELIEIAYDWAPENLVFSARYDEERSASYVASIATLASKIAKKQK